jgi:hypothetical protein
MPLYYGKTLTDYFSSLNTVASYVPNYSTGKIIMILWLKPTVDCYNQFYNISDSKLSTNNSFTLLANNFPPLSRANQLYNRNIRNIREREARNGEANRKIMEQYNLSKGQLATGPLLSEFIQKVRAIYPINFINNIFKVIDQRNRIWNFLNSKELSRLVTGANLAIPSKFGKKRKRRVQKSYDRSKIKRIRK